MKILSLVRTQSFLTQLDRYMSVNPVSIGWVSIFTVKEFKRHAHFNSIQLYFIFFFQK